MLAPTPRSSTPAAWPVHVDFPLCRDLRHEEVVRRAIARVAEFLAERLPDGKLVGLVLTGSFARGEGSVMAARGRLRVLGDIEFLAVLRTEVEFHAFRPRMPGWAREAAELVRPEIDIDIEFGPVDVTYLRRRARPSIFVYDLIRHGKVVWGPADLLQEVPPFGAARIPHEDALFLLFNRTIEQLDAWDRAAQVEGEALRDLAYQRLKLLLDLAGSALAFAGRHEPSYEARPGAFARLLRESPALASMLTPSFSEDLARAARLKIAPGDGRDVLPPAPSVEAQRAWIRARIAEAVPRLAAFLTWELSAVLGAEAALPALLARWSRTPSFSRRLWDWGKIALHPVPPPLPLSRVRAARLFFRSTPRALLYTAGALAYLNLAGSAAPPSSIRSLLPARRRALGHDAEALRRAVVALWRWCVRNN